MSDAEHSSVTVTRFLAVSCFQLFLTTASRALSQRHWKPEPVPGRGSAGGALSAVQDGAPDGAVTLQLLYWAQGSCLALAQLPQGLALPKRQVQTRGAPTAPSSGRTSRQSRAGSHLPWARWHRAATKPAADLARQGVGCGCQEREEGTRKS